MASPSNSRAEPLAGEVGRAISETGGGRGLSWPAFEERSVRLARALRATGLVDGDRVALLMENRAEWLIVMWALRRAGLLLVPVNWHLKGDEVRYIVENSGARVLVTSESLLDVAAQASRNLPALRRRLTVDRPRDGFESLDTLCAGLSSERPPDEREGGVMPYSSGTSGRPKGVLRPPPLTPFGPPNGLETLLAGLYGMDASTVYLSPAPLYHASPIGFTNAVLRAGGEVVVMPRFDPEAALEAITRFRVTHVQFVPTHFVRLLRLPETVREAADLSSLKVVVHAAAPCPPDVKRAMIEWLGPIVYEYYSGSERCGLTALDSMEWLAHPGSVGRSRTGAIHIVDPDSGEELATGETGLVYFENPMPFEFHGQPGRTADVFNAQGWGTHGDLGRLDADGYLYLVDRLSHMIISGGVNIYPQETENVLITHPAVADVAVIGVPDVEFGEAVKAVVTLEPGVEPPPTEALVAWCRERISGYKCPKSVEVVDALPRHPNGKLHKRELRARYWPSDARI